MKKPKNIIRQIRIDFLNYKVNVVITPDVNGYRNNDLHFIGFKRDKADFIACHTYDFDVALCQSWIILPIGVRPGIVAHEVLHCVELVDKYYSIKSKEFRAYLMEYLVDEIEMMIER